MNQALVKGKIKAAALQNKAGRFVMPTRETGAAALNNIKRDGNLAGEDPNPAGVNSYPISTLTWILAYRSGNGAKTQSIRTAMNHLLSPAAQNQAASLGYVAMCLCRAASSTRPRKLLDASGRNPDLSNAPPDTKRCPRGI